MRFVMLVLLLAACSDKKPANTQPANGSGSTGTAVADKPPFAVAVPEVAGPGVVPLDERPTSVAISARGEITINGERIGTASLDGTSAPLAQVVDFVKGMPEHSPRALVVADPSLRFPLVFGVLEAVGKGGIRSYGLAATQHGAPVMVRVRLADTADAPAVPADSPGLMKKPPALGLVLQVTTRKLLLWSTSGEEGTQPSPKYNHPLDGNFTELTATLDEIVKRRAATQMLDGTSITVMVDPEQNVQVLLDALAAVGKAFPDVELAMGVR